MIADIKTDRLIIRKPTLSDVQAYKEIQNSEHVLKYNPMKKKDEEDIKREFNTNDGMRILQTHDNIIVGALFVDEDSLRFWEKSVEISFFTSDKHARKGYMSEALSAVIKSLFTEHDILSITARVFADNVASISLISKLKFNKDGCIRNCVMHRDVLHDDMLFSLTKEEYMSAN